jgi:hypothetical protein
MINVILKDILGGILIVTSLFDAWKYIWQAQLIKKIGTAKGHSRKFLNVAIFNDIIKFGYGVVILDIFIILSSCLALVTMCYNFYTVYKFYPYRCRGLSGFKKPNIFYYIINSMIPNRIRKRL